MDTLFDWDARARKLRWIGIGLLILGAVTVFVSPYLQANFGFGPDAQRSLTLIAAAQALVLYVGTPIGATFFAISFLRFPSQGPIVRETDDLMNQYIDVEPSVRDEERVER
ncbi:hypothetical protein [Humidisolicoccus flavus]|uniref:hypothetical protein n=1 Tax=Humidisolicoccus flavus TaxID=3111414 RepID=UPI0032509E34